MEHIKKMEYSQKDNTLKLLAMIFMVIDHIGYFLFPQVIILRVVGRLSFPLYIYLTLKGAERTRNFPKYICNLVFVGLISTVVAPSPINVLYDLATIALAKKYPKLTWVCLIMSAFGEYSIYGFILAQLIDITLIKKDKKLMPIAVVCFIFCLILSASVIQLFALPALLLINYLPENAKTVPVPKIAGYMFYPVHLFILQLIKIVI